MAAQAEDHFPDLGVPDLDFAVGMHVDEAGDRGEAATVGTEGHRSDCLSRGRGRSAVAGRSARPTTPPNSAPAIASRRPSGLNCTPVDSVG